MMQKKGSALPVRLTEDEKGKLTNIAEHTGLTVSAIIRLLINALIRHYIANGNHLRLPFEISNREKIEEN